MNKKLQPFVGKWKTSGKIEKTPFGSAGILKGHDSYEWFDNKDFLIHKVNVKMGRRKIQNCEVISFDKKKNKFAMYAFDNEATAGVQFSNIKDQKWSVDGKGIRFRGEFNKSFTELTGEWQYKDGSKWKRWMSLRLKRERK